MFSFAPFKGAKFIEVSMCRPVSRMLRMDQFGAGNHGDDPSVLGSGTAVVQ